MAELLSFWVTSGCFTLKVTLATAGWLSTVSSPFSNYSLHCPSAIYHAIPLCLCNDFVKQDSTILWDRDQADRFNGCKKNNTVRWLALFARISALLMCHLDPSFVLNHHPGIWTCEFLWPPHRAALSRHALHQPQLSSQDSHNTLHLMRRWELHPHRWILFLWAVVDYLPWTVISGFQHFCHLVGALIH